MLNLLMSATKIPFGFRLTEVRMRGFHLSLFLIGSAFLIVLAFAGCGSKEYPPELMEAKAAVAESKADGAAEKCPDEFKSAESMLQKAEAYYASKEEDAMKDAAKNTIKLADDAKQCAGKKVTETPPPAPQVGELPKELAEFKETVFFPFNDNSITASETAKLKKAVAMIQQYQGKVKFWVLLTASSDAPGSQVENFELSKRRGIVARNYMADMGIDPNILMIKPLGDTMAVKASKKKVKNAEFRKVDLTFIPFNALQSIKVGSPFVYEKGMNLPQDKPATKK
jgi:outer membrane protein OmpA-like peptidoglycan-associated protein